MPEAAFVQGREAIRRGVAVLLVLAVSACASVGHDALDRTIVGRSVEGRLSVRYKDVESTKEDALSGRFVWTAAGDDVELSLLDPFGQTVALVRSGPDGASITFRDGRRVDGATPDALTRRALGWSVPLQGLRYWLDGRNDPARAAVDLPDGRLRQDDWTIRFTRADDAPAGAPPKRIDLAYPGPPVEIEMRLVVDDRSDP